MEHQSQFRKTLMTVRELMIPVEGGANLGPITWEMKWNSRVQAQFHSSAQWEGFLGVLSGEVNPRGGSFEEINPIRAQSDRYLLNTLDLNQTIGEFLELPNTPEFVWLKNRRRSLGVLLNTLGITPDLTRRSLKFLDKPVQDKFWVLKFLVSRAELLMGNEIFLLEDPEIQRAFHLRWSDFPGILICGAPEKTLHGPIDTKIFFDSNGKFRLESISPPGEDERPGDKKEE